MRVNLVSTRDPPSLLRSRVRLGVHSRFSIVMCGVLSLAPPYLRYYVVFIDDYSRYSWTYLMKTRDEIFPIFVRFYNQIRNVYHRRISTFRSDNAREFLSREFCSFLSSHGIRHQTLCPYTPQRNGVVERKIRHITETARTLRFHMHVPRIFWAHAVLAATYLINRLPSTVLKGRIPWCVLHPNEPLFPLPARVFGCVSYIHVLGPTRDKFGPQAIRTLFLGYASSQKRYVCYSTVTRRFYVSADVTFHEHTPFFPPSSADLSYCPRPTDSDSGTSAPAEAPFITTPPLFRLLPFFLTLRPLHRTLPYHHPRRRSPSRHQCVLLSPACPMIWTYRLPCARARAPVALSIHWPVIMTIRRSLLSIRNT